MLRTFASAALASIVLAPLPAAAQHQHPATHQHAAGAGHEQLGTVDFATSCSAAAQPQFNRAVALLHSFEFGARDRRVQRRRWQTDPSCAMADWGIALSRWGNPFALGIRAAGAAAAGPRRRRRAPRRSGRRRERERALHRRRRRSSIAERRHGRSAHAHASPTATRWRRVAARQPGRHRGAIFYALSLAAAAPPTDKTYADQLKAGAILERLFADAAGSPGPRALHHPQLRRAGARRPRARGGAPLREDRAVGAARAPHAVAHVHARRLLAGVDRHQHRVGRGRASATARPPKSCTRWTTWPTPYLQTGQDARGARAARRRCPAVKARFDPERDRSAPRRARPASSRWPRSRRATRSSAATGRTAAALDAAAEPLPVRRRADLLRARRSARRAPATPRRPRAGDRRADADPRRADGRRRRPTGPSRPRSSGARRRRGWRSPKAGAPRRWPRCAAAADRRGRDREGGGDAGPAGAGARAARRDAAADEAAGGGARRSSRRR